MTAGKIHRPTPAKVLSAFDWAQNKSPTAFATRKERGRHQAQQSLTMTDSGRAAIAKSAEMMNKIVRGK